MAPKFNNGHSVDFNSHGAILPNHNLTTIYCRATSIDMRRKTNFYEVLSLSSHDANINEIKKAYRSMALQYHPDDYPPSRKEEFTRMFVELHLAYQTLSDPASRRKYDCELKMGEKRRNVVVRPEFEKETWEAQLCELRRCSYRREKATSEKA